MQFLSKRIWGEDINDYNTVVNVANIKIDYLLPDKYINKEKEEYEKDRQFRCL